MVTLDLVGELSNFCERRGYPRDIIIYSGLTLSLLMMTEEAFVDNVDQDQTAQNVQSDP